MKKIELSNDDRTYIAGMFWGWSKYYVPIKSALIKPKVGEKNETINKQ